MNNQINSSALRISSQGVYDLIIHPNFNHLADDLAELLVKHHGVSRVIRHRKRAASVPAPEEAYADIAANADAASGPPVYLPDSQSINGFSWMSGGGTSIASPLMAAMFTNTLAQAGFTTGIGHSFTWPVFGSAV